MLCILLNGGVIAVLLATKCFVWPHLWIAVMFYYWNRPLRQCGCVQVRMGNCYRMPRRSGARKDVTAVYRPSSTFNKSDASSYLGHSGGGSHNAYIGGSVSRRAVSSSTSLQHISEREPDGQRCC